MAGGQNIVGGNMVNATDCQDSRLVKPRWYSPKPAWLIVGLLVAEAILWLSERFHWFPFNQRKGWTVLIAITGIVAVILLMFVWFLVSLLFRWRFQFSLRALLVLAVAVALACSWLAVEMKAAAEQKRFLKVFCRRYSTDGDSVLPSAWGLGWFSKVLGEDFFRTVVEVSAGGKDSPFGDVECEQVGKFVFLRTLSLCWFSVNWRVGRFRVAG